MEDFGKLRELIIALCESDVMIPKAPPPYGATGRDAPPPYGGYPQDTNGAAVAVRRPGFAWAPAYSAVAAPACGGLIFFQQAPELYENGR